MTKGEVVEKKKDSRIPVRGTREWAVAEINCCLGCPHGCRYCYARYDAVLRQGTVSADDWTACRVLPEEVDRKHPRYPGQVMFPTAHDIVPENLDACLQVLRNLIEAGNKVLVVSKPNLECIRSICSELRDDSDSILFRFTITARDQGLLDVWEPQAPGYMERIACLEYACTEGFATSVSVEPMLDTGDVVAMVHELLPYVSHSLWLGKMNKIAERVVCDSETMRAAIEKIADGQSDQNILRIYHALRDNKKVRWKESVKMVVGLDLSLEAGLDI